MTPIQQVPIQGMVNASGVGVHFSLEVRDVDLLNCTIKALLTISALIPGKLPLGMPTVIFQREETYNVPGISPHPYPEQVGQATFTGAGGAAISTTSAPQSGSALASLPETKGPTPAPSSSSADGNTVEAQHLKSLHAAVDQLTIALGQIGRTA